jgi:hypothetical protein
MSLNDGPPVAPPFPGIGGNVRFCPIEMLLMALIVHTYSPIQLFTQ